MKIRGIMFDLDGTLVQFTIDHAQIRKMIIKNLKNIGNFPINLYNEHYSLIMINRALKYLKIKKKWSKKECNNLKFKLYKKIATIERQAATNPAVIPEMEDVLAYNKRKKVKLGIITLNNSENAYLTLKSAQFGKYFSNKLIIGRDKTPHIKPHPDHPKTLLNRMNIPKSQVILIGDHPSDIEAANAIQITSIGIVGGKYPNSDYSTPFLVSKKQIYPKLLQTLKKIEYEF